MGIDLNFTESEEMLKKQRWLLYARTLQRKLFRFYKRQIPVLRTNLEDSKGHGLAGDYHSRAVR